LKQIELNVGECECSDATADAIEAVMIERGLQQTLKGGLHAYPGCVHWHFKMLGQTGTLEVTMWPTKQRVWLSVQSRRRVEWIERSLKKIARALQRELAK
jgi:hypothetical protein